MHRSLLSAAALATLAAGASAGTASEDWLTLDRQIESLAATTRPEQAADKQGFEVSGWLRTSYNNTDLVGTPEGGDEISGFRFEGIRLNFKGQVGAYEIKVSIDSSTKGNDLTDLRLKDGYARFSLTDSIHAQLGQFKSRFLFSSYSSDEKLVMYRRTLIGEGWRERDPGVQLDGHFGPFIAILQAQNGNDGAGDKWALTAKAIWAVVGKPIEKQSGGYGPDAETALTLGLGYFDDGDVDDGQALSAEGQFSSGPWWAQAEIVDVGDDYGDIERGPAKNAGLFPGATPWSATGAFMLNQHWELAARYAEGDDEDNTSAVTGGVTWYVNGHATKWQVNYVVTDSDEPDRDGDIFVLGFTIIV